MSGLNCDYEACGDYIQPRTKGCLCIGVPVVAAIAIFLAVLISSSRVIVEEGTVGIYYVHEALDDTALLQPGVRWVQPFVSRVESVTTRTVEERLRDVGIVTLDGITCTFRGIQAISIVDETKVIPIIRKFGPKFRQVMYDRVFAELRDYCKASKMDDLYGEQFSEIQEVILNNTRHKMKSLKMDGIDLLNLVIPKPEIPSDLKRYYLKVKEEFAKLKAEEGKQIRAKEEAETRKIIAIAEEEQARLVAQKKYLREQEKKAHEQKIALLDISIRKQMADTKLYEKQKEAEANVKLYSPDFIKLETAKALAENTKFFFSGEGSPLGSVLAKIFGQV